MIEWIAAIPFVLSIAVKLFARVFDGYVVSRVKQDMPGNYKVSAEQQETIIGMSLDGSERISYIVGLFSGIIGVVAAMSTASSGLMVVAILILVIVAMPVIIVAHQHPLGYLRVNVPLFTLNARPFSIRRGAKFLWLLILLDVVVGTITVASATRAAAGHVKAANGKLQAPVLSTHTGQPRHQSNKPRH